jgi:hypothetical protein
MKVACTTNGEQIIANPTAPRQAFCPVCGGTLTLRSRRTMNNGQKTYYWRHRSNRNTQCSARNRPMN